MDLTHRRAFGLALRTLRKQAGLTQQQVATAAGISRSYLSDMERGERDPTLDTVFRVAGILEVPASGLVAEIERNHPLLDACKGTHILVPDKFQTISHFVIQCV